MQITTLNKYIKPKQVYHGKNALKESLIYLFIMIWCVKLVSAVLACYTKTLTVCGTI